MNNGFQYNDGGRAAAGYKGSAGDCVVRAVAIASGLPYAEVYDALSKGTGTQRASKHTPKRRSSARSGINVRRKWFKDYMTALGFEWVPTMHIGSGCQVHLNADELPSGRLVVSVSKHYTTMIDGVIHDTFDPRDRPSVLYSPNNPDIPKGAKPVANGWWSYQPQRCVYGYWKAPINYTGQD